eukprot:scaffold24326_cov191-Cylindrotheca_fusiformis.AAC.2
MVGVSVEKEDDEYFQLLKRASYCAKEECSLEESYLLLQQVETLSECDAVPLAEIKEELRQRASSYSLEKLDSKLESSRFLPRLTHRWVQAVLVARKDWPLLVFMLLLSTYSTVTAPTDDIVIRIGWALQDWNNIGADEHVPILIYVAALYMAFSDVVSCLLLPPVNKE